MLMLFKNQTFLDSAQRRYYPYFILVLERHYERIVLWNESDALKKTQDSSRQKDGGSAILASLRGSINFDLVILTLGFSVVKVSSSAQHFSDSKLWKMIYL